MSHVPAYVLFSANSFGPGSTKELIRVYLETIGSGSTYTDIAK